MSFLSFLFHGRIILKGRDCKLGSDGGEIVTVWGKGICSLSHRGAFSQEGHGLIGSGQT